MYYLGTICKSQEKLETKLMQNLGGQTKSVIVFSEVAYPLKNIVSAPLLYEFRFLV